MLNTEPGHPQPLFLNGNTGRLFAIWHAPARVPHRALLHVPAFGEEMHKSRRMVALLAQALREQGTATLLLDPFGTGDSDGELEQATWQGWKDDFRVAHGWLHEQGITEVVLWGHRLGALLAAELASEFDDVRQLLLWNPVATGERYLTQFLRLRAASSLMRGEQETAKQLREQLRRQGTLAVAGSILPENLAASIERLKLIDLVPPGTVETAWFDVAANVAAQPGAATTRVVSKWQAAACKVQTALVQGEPFWSTQEISLAPDLIDASVQFLSQTDSDASDAGLVSSPVPAPVMAQTDADTGEQALRFNCEGDDLIGVLHPGAADSQHAVLVIVGGPQYRAGSHRQFVQLARALDAAGVPTLRFDYRSMGDGEGTTRDFEDIQADIRAAMDALCARCPKVNQVTLWGLCDGASAACFYAASDARVNALVLLNPWVRTEAGEAKAYITHYYLGRILSRDFWRKLLRGEIKLIHAISDFIGKLKRALFAKTEHGSKSGPNAQCAASANTPFGSRATTSPAPSRPALPTRMALGLEAFTGQVLFILSGKDLTAQEFRSVSKASRRWRALLRRTQCSIAELSEADHTFSEPAQHELMIRASVEFLSKTQQ